MIKMTDVETGTWQESPTEAIARRAAHARAGAAGRQPIAERGYRQVGVKLPRATLAIIDREATACGLKRSTFLQALLLHKLGRLRLERRPDAAAYRFTAGDWIASERYIWHQGRALNRAFDELRLQSGNLRPGAWIVLAVNEWVGLPTPVSK